MIKVFMFAAAIGYVVGTLWAPKKGSLLRDEIRGHFSELQSEASEIKTEAVQTLTRASEHVVKANDSAKNAFAKLDKNVHEIIQST